MIYEQRWFYFFSSKLRTSCLFLLPTYPGPLRTVLDRAAFFVLSPALISEEMNLSNLYHSECHQLQFSLLFLTKLKEFLSLSLFLFIISKQHIKCFSPSSSKMIKWDLHFFWARVLLCCSSQPHIPGLKQSSCQSFEQLSLCAWATMPRKPVIFKKLCGYGMLLSLVFRL